MLVVALGELKYTGCFADLAHTFDDKSFFLAPAIFPFFEFLQDFSLEHTLNIHFFKG